MKKREYELDSLKFFAILLVYTTHFLAKFNSGVFNLWKYYPSRIIFGGLTGKLGVAIFGVLLGYFAFKGGKKGLFEYSLKRYGYFVYVGLFINTINAIMKQKSLFSIISVSFKIGSSLFPTYWCMLDFLFASIIAYYLGNKKAKTTELLSFILILLLIGRIWTAICLFGLFIPTVLDSKLMKKRWVSVVLLLISFASIKMKESNITYICYGVFAVLLVCVINNFSLLKRILSNKVTATLGKNSMAIFVIHPLMYNLIGKWLFNNYFSTRGFGLVFVWLVCFVAICLISFPITYFFDFYGKAFDVVSAEIKTLFGKNGGEPLNEKYKKRILVILEVIVYFCVFLVSALLFYHQIMQTRALFGKYASDISQHIIFGVNGRGYSLLYFAIGILNKFTNVNYSLPILMGILVAIGIWCEKELIKKYFKLHPFIALFIAGFTTILGSLYVPKLAEAVYRGGLVTQPWHNITYIGMRSLCCIFLYFFVNSFDNYLEGVSLKNWLGMAFFLTCGTAIKPSFVFTFSIALLLILIVDFIKKKAQWKYVKNMIALGSVVIPSIIVCLFQSSILFHGATEAKEATGIAFVFLGSRFFSVGVFATILKLLRAFLLPAIIIIVNRKKLTKLHAVTIIYSLLSLFTVMFLQETGPRAADGNFYWGMYMAGFVLFMFTLPLLANNYKEYYKTKNITSKGYIYIISTGLLVLWHLASSLSFFYYIMRGGHQF